MPSYKDIEAADFIDDVPVVRADGTTTTLGDIDPDPAYDDAGEESQIPQPKAKAARTSTKAAPKTAGKAAPVQTGRRSQSPAASVKAPAQQTAAERRAKVQQAAADAKEQKRLEAAQKKIQEEKEQLAKGRKELAEQKKAQAQAFKIAALAVEIVKVDPEYKLPKDATLKQVQDALRTAKANAKAQEREAAKARARAEKLVKEGTTGDAVQDDAYQRALTKADALALRPVDTTALGRSFLTIPGVVLTRTSLTLPENVLIDEWEDAVAAMLGVNDVAAFAVGDALLYGEARYNSAQFKNVCAKLNLADSTVANFKYVCNTFDKNERVEGASFTAHLEVASLKNQNPAAARNILEQAVEEKRPVSWVRQQVNAYKTGPTRAQKEAQRVEQLVQLSQAQYEEDLAALGGNKAAVAKYVNEHVEAFLKNAELNDTVSSETAVRHLARLQARVTELENENYQLRLRLEAYEKILGEREAANARIVSGDEEDQGFVPQVIEGEWTVNDQEPAQGLETDFGFLSDLDATGAADEAAPEDEGDEA